MSSGCITNMLGRVSSFSLNRIFTLIATLLIQRLPFFVQSIRYWLRMHEYNWRTMVCTWCIEIISIRTFFDSILWSDIPHLVSSSTFSTYSQQATYPNCTKHFAFISSAVFRFTYYWPSPSLVGRTGRSKNRNSFCIANGKNQFTAPNKHIAVKWFAHYLFVAVHIFV